MAKIRIYTKEEILNTFPNKNIEVISKNDIENIKFVCAHSFVKYGEHWLKCEATRDGNWNILSSNKCFPISENQERISVKPNCKIKRYVKR